MKEQQAFITYLQSRGFRPQTIYGYTNKLRFYLNWCEDNNIDYNITSLDDVYDYKRYCKEQGLAYNTIRERICVVKHYFQSIQRKDNPALMVKHAKQTKTLPSNLLSEEDLKNLYRSIQAQSFIQRRDKVMFGMVIFQALKREECDLLELGHLDLEEATLYIPETTKTHSRRLPLHPIQMQHLLTYLYEFRPKLLTEAKKETSRLFFSMGKGSSLGNALQYKCNELKRSYPLFKTLTQLRESRMTLWVREYGVRKAQYMSGIKYSSSMMRYKTTDIEKLKRKLSIVHPMERFSLY